jgi:hypothetical protein
LLERIEFESFWLRSPALADVFVRREAFERLQPMSEIVCFDEVLEMLPKLLVAFVIEALDGSFLDGSIHSLDVTVGRGMFRFGQPMIDIVLRAGEFESVGTEEFASFDGFFDLGDGGATAARYAKVDPVAGENWMDLVRYGRDEAAKEVAATLVVAFSCNSAKANFEVRSMPTKRWSLPCDLPPILWTPDQAAWRSACSGVI